MGVYPTIKRVLTLHWKEHWAQDLLLSRLLQDNDHNLFELQGSAIAWGQVTLSEAFSYAKATYDKSFQAFH